MCASKTPVVCSFESRRADEMSDLVRKNGGHPVVAPSMKEVPLLDNPEAVHRIREIIDGQIPLILFLTGVGTDALFELADQHGLKQALHQAILQMTVIARGPKPVAVLHRLGIRCDVRAAEPNTWRDVMDALMEHQIALTGKHIAVQEYGVPNQRLYDALTAAGAISVPVPVYRWALPDDTHPLISAIERTVADEIDILMFTSANQVASVLSVAHSHGLQDQFLKAASQCLVASVGPTCSEMLTDSGFLVRFEASPPKLGPLVRGAIDCWRQSITQPDAAPAAHGSTRQTPANTEPPALLPDEFSLTDEA